MEEFTPGAIIGPLKLGIKANCGICLHNGEKKTVYMCKYFSVNAQLMAEYYCDQHGQHLMIQQAMAHAENDEAK